MLARLTHLLATAPHEGQVEKALTRLNESTTGPAKATNKLELAALYALQGEGGLEHGTLYLIGAAEADRYISVTPLYQALCWEFAAYCGEHPKHIRKGLKAVLSSGHPLALFHGARALAAAGMNRRAVRVLESLDDEQLPAHLVWRRWSLLGLASANCGELDAAVRAYFVSAQLTQGLDAQRENLSLAEGWLALGQLDEAFMVLDGFFDEKPGDQTLADVEQSAPHDEIKLRHRYLWALLQTRLGNAQLALNALLEAYTLAQVRNYTVFEILLELGRTYLTLGNEAKADSSYQKARLAASAEQLSFINHEHAVMLSEAGRYAEAQKLLKKAAADKHYGGRCLAVADLAHVLLAQGQLDQAKLVAEHALKAEANASACITLAEIALQNFDYSAARRRLEQAVSLAKQGDADWLSAQVLFAEVFAQQDYLEPELLIYHAEQALTYLQPKHEWVATLEAYISEAKTRLGQTERWLN